MKKLKMRQLRIIHRTGRIVLLAWLLQGCLQDEFPVTNPNEECEILFDISVPENSSALTRSLTAEEESRVDNIYAFVFKINGSTLELDYYTKATVTGTTGNGLITTGKVPLQIAPAGQKHRIVFITNAETEILAKESQITQGMTYAAFIPILTTSISSLANSDPSSSFRIPMWGETGEVTISQTLSLTQSDAVTMQRCLAKVNIGVNMDSDYTAQGLPDFELKEVTLYGALSSARIIPAPENVNNDGYVMRPTIEGAATTNLTRTISSGHGSFNSIYIPETPIDTSKEVADYDGPYIIVKGIYTGQIANNTNETYYKIYFGKPDGNNGLTLVEILRNHSYIFNIKSVYREGYPTLQEAMDHLPLGVDYEFLSSVNSITADYKSFVYNDRGFLGVTSTAFELHCSVNQIANFYYKAQYLDNTSPTVDGYFCDEYGNKKDQTNFSVSPSTDRFSFTTLSDNTGETTDVIEYFKVYLTDSPELHQIVKIWQGSPRVDDVQLWSTSTMTVYNAVQYLLFPRNKGSNSIYVYVKGNLPAGIQFRYRRTEDGYTATNNSSNSLKVSPNNSWQRLNSFSSTTSGNHTHPYYMEGILEWEHPNGTWIEMGRYEHVNLNYRDPVTGIYFAAADAQLNGVSGGYPQTWNVHMGISSAYQSTLFNANGNYVTTENTGCAAYYEGTESDPVTGIGKWRLPSAEELERAANNTGIYQSFQRYGTANYGTTTINYFSYEESSATEVKTYNFSTGTTTLTIYPKTSALRVRCVRVAAP
ncbi:MAG: DUF1566 domain-containing protein [Bacteroides sp.]|nr:DUF1566 domain-containing protein [Bacteroides sp.]